MRIRKLELYGFKSFPERTSLHFGSGLACVVGPNGCGKSNIVDAIKWCVGEQSAKSLRGDDMLDVIFAGSADRQPVGYAEVSITFSAEGGEPLPGEYARFSEISIGRRLHRDGTSEYLINQTRCRRKDVVDLFLDTGVGSNLYSFIEQGRIGEIVQASPEKRRALIDEAAGISRYKARRDEAQQRLDATASQLDRVADVTDEMTRRLKVLEAQVLRAARFRRVRAIVRQQEIFLALAKYADRAAERRSVREQLLAAQNEVAGLEREVARRDADLVTRREEIEVVEHGTTQWRDEVAELDARRRELDGARGFLEKGRGEIDEELGRSRDALTSAGRERDAAASEATEAATSATALAATVGDADARLVDAKKQVAAADVARQAARARREEADRASAGAVASSSAEKARADELVRRAVVLPGSLSRVDAAIDAANKEVDGLVDRARKAAGAVEARKKTLEASKAALAAIQEKVARALAAEKDARAEVERLEQAAEAQRRADEQAIAAATRAVETAERDARAAIATAERGSADAAKRAQADAASRAETAARVARDEIREAEARADAWRRALERAEAEGLDRLQKTLDADDRKAEEASAASRAAAERVERETATRAEAEATSAGAARIAAATSARDAARTSAEAATKTLADLDARVTALAAEEQQLDARRRGLEAAAKEEQAKERGAALIREKFPHARPLVEHLAVAEADEAWVAAVLDDRLLLPVLRTVDEVRSAAAVVGDARAAVLWIPEGADPLQTALGGVALVDDLATALARHAETGAPVAVRATGERVEGGVVRLGRGGQAASAALKRRRELTTVSTRLTEVRAALTALRAERPPAVSAVADAKKAVEAAEIAVRRAEDEARAAVRAAVDAVRREGEARLAAAATSAEADRKRRRADRERILAEARQASADRVAKTAGEARDALAALRAAVDERAAGERALAQDAAEQARTAAASSVEAARREGEAKVVAAREAVEAVRKEAAARAGEAKAAVDAARRAADLVRNGREQEEAAATTARAEQFQGEVALARADGDAATIAAATERARVRIAELQAQRDGLLREQKEVAEAQAASAVTLARLDQERITAEASAREATVAWGAAESVAEVARKALSEAEVAAAALAERVTAAEARAATARRRAEEAATRAEALRTRIAELETARGDNATREQEIVRELQAVEARRVEAGERLQRERERLAALRKALRDAENAVREQTERRDAARAKASDLDTELKGIQLEIDGLRERMDERYQVSLPGLLDRLEAQRSLQLHADDGVREGLELGSERVEGVPTLILRPPDLQDVDRIEKLVASLEEGRRQLAAFGEVNLAAYDEYRELFERHADLVAQRADLEASVESIRSAIAKMNKTCRQRFRDAFDRVNENFQAAYPKLVGGGSARLSLTDEEDLLETGVDIFVQPPGKRLQNLSLLSGGEKAMAAIALLLALFQVKPSPFCLLDEVDAPLDEANGGRFNEMLKEMCGISQFIVITHNRKTMEAADTLYGITMPTPGVSRLVSVRIGA